MQQPEIVEEPRPGPAQLGAAGDWLTAGRFALLLGLLIFAAFPQVLLGVQTFVVRDFGFFAYPLAHYQRECFWRGELPLWNPYNNCGVPFLAQWNTMPLYPPALIYLLLPLNWSLSFFCLLHLFWAGLGMYCLGRRWTGNRLAAAVAGLVFAFNGLSLNLLMWPSHIATLSWMPWVVLCVERAWQEGGNRIVLAALAGALQMLAGGPETILFTWLILVVICALGARPFSGAGTSGNEPTPKCVTTPVSPEPAEPEDGRAPATPHSDGAVSGCARGFALRLGRFSLVVLLVAGLAAAQLLPFLDLAAHSQREGGYADARWSMPGWGWANFLVPMLFGHVWTMGVFFQYEQFWTSSYYLGVGALLLAWLGVWRARRRRVWLLALGAGVALLFAFGDQVFVCRWLRHLVPQLSLMTYPVKYVMVVAFAVPLLAGFGVARLQNRPSDEKRDEEKRLVFLGAVLLVLIGAILFWAWRYPFPMDNFSTTFRNGLSRAGFLVVATLVLLALRRSARIPGAAPAESALSRLQPFLPLLLLLVFWLDVWTHEPEQNPTVPASIYTPGLVRTKLAMQPQPALGESRAMVTPLAEVRLTQFIMSSPKENFLVKRLGYFADCNLLDEVPKVNGFFSLYPRECGELASVLYGSTNADFPRLADFMSVSQITAPGKVFDWVSRHSFLPLATAGQKPVFLDDTNALRSIIRPTFDGSRVVFLPPELRGAVSATNAARARVLSQRFSAERVDLEVEAPEPALVVLSQTYYHTWRAEVDGRPTRLLRANYAFQAVEVPAGSHRVRLVYEDRAFYAGTLVSGISLLACVAGWVWIRQRKRRPAA